MRNFFSKKSRRARIARRILQIGIAIGGLVPVLAGLSGVLLGSKMVDDISTLTLSADSHYRYMSGLLLGIGLSFWATIPNIERHTTLFRTLSGIVVVGGLSRLYALFTIGVPDTSMLFGLGMELVVVPLLALAQTVIARKFA